MNIKALSLTIILLSQVGCAVNGPMSFDTTKLPPESRSKSIQSVSKAFIGVPLIFAVEGTTVRYNKGWIITAAHVQPATFWKMKEYHKHPTCDVMLIKSKSKHSGIPLGDVSSGDKVYHLGYPMIPSLLLAVNEGVYIDNVRDGKGCVYSMSSAAVMSGMSGGSVVSDKGELIGITTGVSNVTMDDGKEYKSVTTFLPISGVKGWIDSVIGNELNK